MNHWEVKVGQVYECRAAIAPGVAEVVAEIPADSRTQRGFRIRMVGTDRIAVVVARHLHRPKIPQHRA